VEKEECVKVSSAFLLILRVLVGGICPGSASLGEFRGQAIPQAVALAKGSCFDKSGLTLCQKGKNPARAAGNRR